MCRNRAPTRRLGPAVLGTRAERSGPSIRGWLESLSESKGYFQTPRLLTPWPAGLIPRPLNRSCRFLPVPPWGAPLIREGSRIGAIFVWANGGVKGMFEGLRKRLGDVFDKLRGRGALSEADVDAALREVRTALLEADVALPVVRQFVDSVRPQAIGADVIRSVSPA